MKIIVICMHDIGLAGKKMQGRHADSSSDKKIYAPQGKNT
jgi:hypothetical protein